MSQSEMTPERWETLKTLAWVREEQDEVTRYVEELRATGELCAAQIAGDLGLSRVLWEKHVGLKAELAEGTPLLVALATQARWALNGCANYIELRFRDDIGEITVLVQRVEGETPAVKAARLTSELERCRQPCPNHQAVLCLPFEGCPICANST